MRIPPVTQRTLGSNRTDTIEQSRGLSLQHLQPSATGISPTPVVTRLTAWAAVSHSHHTHGISIFLAVTGYPQVGLEGIRSAWLEKEALCFLPV
jgi:hypothetical protein